MLSQQSTGSQGTGLSQFICSTKPKQCLALLQAALRGTCHPAQMLLAASKSTGRNNPRLFPSLQKKEGQCVSVYPTPQDTVWRKREALGKTTEYRRLLGTGALCKEQQEEAKASSTAGWVPPHGSQQQSLGRKQQPQHMTSQTRWQLFLHSPARVTAATAYFRAECNCLFFIKHSNISHTFHD